VPKRVKELSALEVGRLKTDGMHPVGGIPGLYLQVTGPARSWILRMMVGSKRRDMGLGSFPAVTLAAAREKARSAREQVAEGVDPIRARLDAQSQLKAKQITAVTFAGAARSFLDAKSDEWKSAKHRQQWENSLENYAMPVIGQLLIGDVKQEHVLAILEPIWKTKTETASRIRGRIEQVLDWATVRGLRSGENPAQWRGRLDHLLAKPSKIAKVEHFASLPCDQVNAFMVDLRGRHGNGARALELLVLTAVRSGEVRGAKWSEIDVGAAQWVIPAERMKAKTEHRVPLTKAALALIEQQPREEGTDLIFPGTKGQPLSDMTLTNIMRRMGLDAVPHGFRSTFRDWVSERTNFPADVAEMALAHTIANKTEAAYRRGDLFAKRAQLMQAWAEFCERDANATGQVLQFKGEAA
jgi:integrase